jgi:hypothetical protein
MSLGFGCSDYESLVQKLQQREDSEIGTKRTNPYVRKEEAIFVGCPFENQVGQRDKEGINA